MATWLLAILLAAALVAFLWLRGRLNDAGVPRARGLFVAGAPKTVMAIWAHPDDEITSAGTLAGMAREKDAQLVLVYLTQGEAARDTGYTRDELARVRRAEAEAAGRLLGASHVEVMGFPDSGLTRTDPAAPKRELRGLIERHRPSVLVTFDEQVGFYGHPDHVQVGRWVGEIVAEARADPAFPVRALYQATLPGALIAMAIRLVAAFRDNYPADPARGLPAPSVAVNISRRAATKRRLLDVHRSQVKIIADVQPYYDRVPAWLYYRLFDREYFTLAASR